MIKIKINGKNIVTKAGKTILEVAKENGFEIPTLCKVKDITPTSSCGLCVVNVVGEEGLVDSCKTPVEEGMVIYTDSRSVRTARKLALELILSDHYADCMAPCNISCPLNLDIQTIISFIKNDLPFEAYRMLKKEIAFPLTLSRICNSFCENNCRRTAIDRPIEIKKLIRFVTEYAFDNKIEALPPKKSTQKEKIAIVGAGISGLSCGYHLINQGYQVDVYEALPEAGGVLRYGIPDFKLPKYIVDYEIDMLLKHGINLIPNTTVGKDITLDEISEKYDAVYLSTGLQKNIPFKIKNYKKSRSVLYGLEFLKNYHLNKNMKLGKTVVVYGNGDIALNCARILKRLDLDVFIFTDVSEDEFISDKKEINKTRAEDINIIFNHRAIEIKRDKSKVKRLVFERDEIINGEIVKKRTEKKVDTIIIANEPKADFDILKKLSKKRLKFKSDGSLLINKQTLYSGIKNIFMGGDLRFGYSKSATKAISDGKTAAKSIISFIKGKKEDNFKPFNSVSEKDYKDIHPKLYSYYKRIKPVEYEPEFEIKKVKNFSEIEIGFDYEEAKQEAALCLECGCKISSDCDLKNYAEEYRIDIQNYAGKRNIYPIDNRHPFIIFDANKCIKCGNCIEVCNDIHGVGVLNYKDKGFGLQVLPEFGKALSATQCLSCGSCIEVCTTSALFEKHISYAINSYTMEENRQNCGLCGLGCEIVTKSQNGKVMIVKPDNKETTENYLCFEGKFGWQVFENGNRVNVPIIRIDKANDWQEENPGWREENNLTKIAKTIKKKLKEAEKKAIFVGPTATIEEILMLKEIANHIGAEISSFTVENSFMDKFYNTVYTEKTYDDLQQADVIVAVGEIPQVLKAKLRKLQKRGKKLVIINQEKNPFNKFADILLDSFPINATLEKIIEYNNLDCQYNGDDCAPDNEDVLPVELPAKTMFIYNKYRVSEQIISNILKLSYQICSEYKQGSGLFEISDFINSKGFTRIGIKKYSLQISDFVILYSAMPNTEQLKWLEKSKFVLYVDTHLESDNIADMFIPRPDYLSIDAIALADGSKVVKFKNVKNEKYFDNILEIFKNAGLLTKDKSNLPYWNQKAKELVENLPEPISYDENRLAELIESIDNVKEKTSRYYPVHYFEINKLKKLIKSETE